MLRREFTKAAFALTAVRYVRAAQGLPPLKIAGVKAIPTSARRKPREVVP